MNDKPTIITWDVLERIKTPKGGYDGATTRALGVPYPLPSGWRERLIGKPLPRSLEARLTASLERKDGTAIWCNDGKSITINNPAVRFAERKDGVLNFDGSCWPNPGPAKGAFILHCGVEMIERSLDFGHGTSNVAEYSSLIAGLICGLERGVTHIEVYGDSQLVIRGVARMKGWAKGKPHLEKLRAEAIELVKRFAAVDLNWVCREQNAECDALSR